MNDLKKLISISALACASLGVALDLAVIAAIWFEAESAILWKSVATLFVLFILSGVLHTVAKGTRQPPGGPQGQSVGAALHSHQRPMAHLFPLENGRSARS